MIVFKYPLERTEIFLEKKVGKERLELLEKTLRMLGNFKEKEDIQIVEEEYREENTLHEVEDLDGTSFKFYNFSTETKKDPNRNRKNYELEMRRKNSVVTFIYDFFDLRIEMGELNIIGIRAHLSSSRTLTIKNAGNHYDRLIIEEGEKSYKLLLHRDSEEEIISSLENIITSLSEIETLNLESILGKLQMNQNLFTIHIDIQDSEKAFISYKDGKISSYSIMEENRKIQGRLGRIGFRQVIEHKKGEDEESRNAEEADFLIQEQINSDIKGLLKSL